VTSNAVAAGGMLTHIGRDKGWGATPGRRPSRTSSQISRPAMSPVSAVHAMTPTSLYSRPAPARPNPVATPRVQSLQSPHGHRGRAPGSA
jgi:hypothetical protein